MHLRGQGAKGDQGGIRVIRPRRTVPAEVVETTPTAGLTGIGYRGWIDGSPGDVELLPEALRFGLEPGGMTRFEHYPAVIFLTNLRRNCCPSPRSNAGEGGN
jgi:hypothetical protein